MAVALARVEEAAGMAAWEEVTVVPVVVVAVAAAAVAAAAAAAAASVVDRVTVGVPAGLDAAGAAQKGAWDWASAAAEMALVEAAARLGAAPVAEEVVVVMA